MLALPALPNCDAEPQIVSYPNNCTIAKTEVRQLKGCEIIRLYHWNQRVCVSPWIMLGLLNLGSSCRAAAPSYPNEQNLGIITQFRRQL